MNRVSRRSVLACASVSAALACGGARPVAVIPPPAEAPVAPAPPDAGPVVSRPPLPKELGAWVDSFVGAFGEHFGEPYAFSGVLVVAQDGKPVLVRAYGKADRVSGAVADENTRFLVGSITKQFTAAAILQLAEKGLVGLSDPVRKYLPDYPSAGDRITLHQLLSHTSGIPATKDGAIAATRDRAHAAAEIVATFASRPLDFEPGTAFEYSNSNYFLLGLILEKASGEPYASYVQKHLLAPAGMTSTGVPDGASVANAAVGYARVEEQLVPARHVDPSVPFAAGALRSTAMDLVRWDHALTGDLVINAESRRKMFTPVKEATKEGYGYGMFAEAIGGHPVHEHNGAIDGFSADLAGIADLGLTVVGLSNNEGFDPDVVVDAVLRMAVIGKPVAPPRELITVPLDAKTIGRFVGEFAMEDASRREAERKMPPQVLDAIQKLVLVEKNGGIALIVGPQPATQLFLGDDGRLFTKHDGVTLEGEPAGPEAKGPVRSVLLKQGPFALRWARGSQKK